MRVASIVGARPNFVKLAPLSKELRRHCEEIIIHTGQHYDYALDRIFFSELGIPEPDYHLHVGSGTHGYQTGEMLKRIEETLISAPPDLVLVFGDTNTTLAGALAAAKLRIPLAHVESGLRSFDRRMPEEINRILVDHCSDLLFCPTETAVRHLAREGITEGVHLTGDVMVDVLRGSVHLAIGKSRILEEQHLAARGYYLATVHRAENTDNIENLNNIVAAFCEIGDVVFLCHPRTERRLKEYGLWDRLNACITVLPPAGFFDMICLERNAKMILTDSGGVQKEAYIFKVPCITLRDSTEWSETLEEGWNVLAGADRDAIISLAEGFQPDEGSHTELFGRGDASARIVEIIRSTFGD